MASLDEKLAQIQQASQHADPQEPGVPSALMSRAVELRGMRAQQLGQRLIDGHQLLELGQDAALELDEDAQVQLTKLFEQEQSFYEERGLHRLRLVLGRVRSISPTDQSEPAPGLALLYVPVYARLVPDHGWELSWSLHPPRLNPQLAEKLELDLWEQGPQAQAIPFHTRWRALVEGIESCALSKDADLEYCGLTWVDVQGSWIAEDLDPTRWSESSDLRNHAIVSGLLGPGFAMGNRAREFCESYLDGSEDASQYDWIEDADQFQAEAILCAASGDHMVLQGPSGSGKTQTITNILAELIGRGKKVLVLASSMPDLQSIEQRLARAGLESAVLPIYDQRRSPEAAAMHVAQALQIGAPSSPERGELVKRYQQLHRLLNEQAHAMREPLGNSSWCYQEVVGRLLNLRNKTQGLGLPAISFESIAHWNTEDLAIARAEVSKLAEHIGEHGTISASPFAKVELGALAVEEIDAWMTRVETVSHSVESLMQCSDELFASFELEPPTTIEDMGRWASALAHFQSCPSLEGLELDRALWSGKTEQIVELLACGRLCQSIREQHQDLLLPPAWEANLVEIRAAWREHGERWWRKASRRFREAKSLLRGLTRGALPEEGEQVVAIIDAVIHYQSERATLQRLSGLGEALFGAHWCGEDSDWDKLAGYVDWLADVRDKIDAGAFPAQAWTLLDRVSVQESRVAQLAQLQANTRELLSELEAKLKVQLSTLDLDNLCEQLASWQEKRSELHSAIAYRALEARLRGMGLSSLVQLASTWSLPVHALLLTVDLSYLQGLERLAFSERGHLRSTTRARLDADRAEFTRLDACLPFIARERLIKKLHAFRPPLDDLEMIELARALEDPQQRGDLAHLLREHRKVIAQLKPLVLASPATLAQYFQDARSYFDCVLIDSAAKMPLFEAMGGILRSKQLIAVGDSRQSPPASLGPKQCNGGTIAPQQSVLFRCLKQGAPEYMLRMHYRSEHESLINYVNEVFYDGQLRVAPSPVQAGGELGLCWDYDESDSCDDHAIGLNVGQAKAVARAAAVHLLDRPEQSLGVIALSEAQARAIRRELESLASDRPELAALLDPERQQALFVHSIETIGREERSVIFLSLGYGRGAQGELSACWGALHRNDGHRALAMALSRASAQLRVFSNVDAQEFCVDEETPTGLSIFVGFLEQSKSGSQRIGGAQNARAGSAFADEVRRALDELGFALRSPTGGHEVDADLYVYDPQDPERALLGILCDTQRYHAQAVARDRERIGTQMLYRMGWKLHRLWCRDWLADPALAHAALREQLLSLGAPELRNLALSDSLPETTEQEAANRGGLCLPTRMETKRGVPQSPHPLSFVAYRSSLGYLDLSPIGRNDELAHTDLLTAIEAAVEQEGSMHLELLILRLAQALEQRSSSARLRESVRAAIERGVRINRLQRQGAFVSREDHAPTVVRNRCALPAAQRVLAWVPPEEIEGALAHALAQSDPHSSGPELVFAALRQLGLTDASSAQRDRLAEQLEALRKGGAGESPLEA